jgi:hypothetical protein
MIPDYTCLVKNSEILLRPHLIGTVNYRYPKYRLQLFVMAYIGTFSYW